MRISNARFDCVHIQVPFDHELLAFLRMAPSPRGCGMVTSIVSVSGLITRITHMFHSALLSLVFIPCAKSMSTKASMSSPEDPVLSDGRSTDMVIPVMGPTKAGKSTFLNQLLKNTSGISNEFPVGRKLASCTQTIDARVLLQAPLDYTALNRELNNRRIVLVDTPGFDDTYRDDREILNRISDWLLRSYKRHMFVGGVLYLHDISRDGFPESSLKNLKMFEKLCGDDAMDQVALVTTKWDRLRNADEGMDRVVELRGEFWRRMTELGAFVFHAQPANTEGLLSRQHKRPWDIIYSIVMSAKARDIRRRILQIQDEMVNRRRLLSETDAGRELRRSLERLLETAKYLRQQEKKEARAGDKSLAKSLEERQDEIDKITAQLKLMEIPGIQERAKRWILLKLRG